METPKIIIYQVFTRLFGNGSGMNKHNGTVAENGTGKMDFFDAKTLDRIKRLGVSHIWYTGIIRHATKTDYSSYGIPRQHPGVVKGKAGSPYAITDYYDIDPDLAVDVDKRIQEFDALVNRTHRSGLKVIIDFVPNHLARQYKSVSKPKGVDDFGSHDNVNMGFSQQNNFYYCTGQPLEPQFDTTRETGVAYHEFPAKATGNDHFDNHPGVNDWYETVKLNYGIDYCDAGGRSVHFNPIPDTWLKMRDILMFWAGKGIDGFRCDMAEMVPPEFWDWCIVQVKKAFPHLIFIGEVYNPGLYRRYIQAGFNYLYDKVGMYDCLVRIIKGESRACDITHQWQATDDIKDHMLYFLENHDEQRLASDFICGDGEKAVPALIVAAMMNRNPFMLYAGQELGEHGMDEEGFSGRDGRTTIFDYWTVASLCHGYVDRTKLTKKEKQLEKTYQQVLTIAKNEAAIKGEFFDLMYANMQSLNFDPRYMYAFLRKEGSETLLIIANFSYDVKLVQVIIPEHAFDYLKLKEGDVMATDLLTGSSGIITLKSNAAVKVTIPPYSGRILKF